MKHSSGMRVYVGVSFGLAMLVAAAPAAAQFQPRPLSDPATGETYIIEGSAALWFPGSNVVVASEGFGIPGTAIDFVNDLGLTDQRFNNLRVVLRPVEKHKLRFEYTPIKYQSSAVLSRSLVFNGIRFNQGLLVESVLDWKAYRFAYEWDFISLNRGFGGFIVEIKHTDVNAELTTTGASEFSRAQAPIPALGGIGRFYVVPNISVTFEMTGFKLPENLVRNATGHYVDVDVYGMLNFNRNLAAQFGYRSLDLGYVVETDQGTYKLKGLYFGVVARY
jgi:hypothetical protein